MGSPKAEQALATKWTNEQEANRFTVNETVDDRVLRELYLLPFEMSVKQGQERLERRMDDLRADGSYEETMHDAYLR